MMQEEGKYLYVPYEECGGLDAYTNDMVGIIQAALAMKRIPIIMKALSEAKHRLDGLKQDAIIDWDRYFNLPQTRIFKVESDGTVKRLSDTLQYVYEQDFNFDLYSGNQIRYIDYTQAYDKENEDYPIIGLLNPGHKVPEFGKKISRWRLFTALDPSFLIIFSPSQIVNDLTDVVLDHFGTTRKDMKFLSRTLCELPRVRYADTILCGEDFNHYACMHVRYEDYGGDLRKYIKRVVEKVYERNDKHTPLYIMSNIKEPKYFDFLKPRYDIYRYTDFEELRQRFSERGEIEHNLLYMVEHNIMEHATVKIFPLNRNMFVFEYPWLYFKSIFGRIF